MSKQWKLWVVLLPAMVLPFVASLFYFVLFSEHVTARLVYAGAKAFLIVWPIVVVMMILGGRFPRLDLGSARHTRALPLGAVVGITIVLLMFALMKTPLGDIIVANSQRISDKTRQLGILEYYWLFAVFLSLVHSLIEEYYWRWFVYGHLRRLCSAAPALTLAGTSFAAHHVVVASQFVPLGMAFLLAAGVGLGGVVWCLMYDRQKTLTGIWISHAIVDFGIMSIGYKLLSQ